MPKLLWNLFRLILGILVVVLLGAAVLYAIRGHWETVSLLVAAMSTAFFTINITNFWEYRWEKSGWSSRSVILAPWMLSLVAIALSLVFAAPVGLAAVGVIVVFWILVTRRRPDLASSRVPARLIIDEEGVRRMYANIQLDSIEWREVVRVAVSKEDDGPVPVDDEFYFFLEGKDDRRCVVPNTYAVELLPRLQRLPGFDNEALVEGALGDDDELAVIWEGRAGQARICGESEEQ